MRKKDERHLTILTVIWSIGLFAYMANDIALWLMRRCLPLRYAGLLTALACSASFSLILNYGRLNRWSHWKKAYSWAGILLLIVFPSTWFALVRIAGENATIIILSALVIAKVLVLMWLRRKAVWLLQNNYVLQENPSRPLQ